VRRPLGALRTLARPIHHGPPGLALRLQEVDPAPNSFRPREAPATYKESFQVAEVDRVTGN
jgi:hypothetical protein